MSFAPSSPVTGGAQTGFTSPTYTLTADNAPTAFTKQYAVTALGGTQAGVGTHSADEPFWISMARPQTFKSVGVVNPVTGRLSNVPYNTWKIFARAAGLPLADQSRLPIYAEIQLRVPAGVSAVEPARIRGLLSLLIGTLNQQSAGIGDSVVSGILG